MTRRLEAAPAGGRRLALAAVLAALAWRASAQAPLDARFPARPLEQTRPAILENVDIREQLGRPVPASARFRASDGRALDLGELLHRGRPVMLALVYYNCPSLCGLVLKGLSRALRQSGLALGRDYDALAVSFDPKDTIALAAERQKTYLEVLGRPEAAASWQFLVGTEPEIRKLTDAAGFRYAYDAASGQYAHAAAVVALTPDGRVSRYLYGIEYAPRDVKLALLEAGGGRVGTSIDRVLLTCYRYDPVARRYEPYILGILRLASAAMALGVIAALAVAWRREWKRGTVR